MDFFITIIILLCNITPNDIILLFMGTDRGINMLPMTAFSDDVFLSIRHIQAQLQNILTLEYKCKINPFLRVIYLIFLLCMTPMMHILCAGMPKHNNSCTHTFLSILSEYIFISTNCFHQSYTVGVGNKDSLNQ